jgi:hypothetical protein
MFLKMNGTETASRSSCYRLMLFWLDLAWVLRELSKLQRTDEGYEPDDIELLKSAGVRDESGGRYRWSVGRSHSGLALKFVRLES